MKSVLHTPGCKRTLPIVLFLVVMISMILAGQVGAEEPAKPEGLKFTCKHDEKTGAPILDVRDNVQADEPGFGPYDGGRFKRALKECLDQEKKITRINFTSDGGNVNAALEIAQTIADYRFHTHVPAGSRCISACTLAFLGGFRRTVDPQGSYEVHGFSSYAGEGSLKAAKEIMDLLTSLKSKSEKEDREEFEFPEIASAWKQMDEKQKEELKRRLAIKIQKDRTEIERSSASLTRRLAQFLLQRRVSSKFLDHMFATTILGVRPLTREEMKDLAVVTGE